MMDTPGGRFGLVDVAAAEESELVLGYSDKKIRLLEE